MNKPTISIIAAIGESRELGKDNKLLWQIPEDMKRFREKTAGHSVIMGRKTYESIGKPLPHRLNIVVSRNPGFHPAGVIVTGGLEQAITRALQEDTEEIFVIGGGEIYKQALPLADKLYLTVVHASAPADTYFPEYAEFGRVTKREERQSGQYQFSFLELER
jgi:dihydrofolate reductase